jgi:hypothetical protein
MGGRYYLREEVLLPTMTVSAFISKRRCLAAELQSARVGAVKGYRRSYYPCGGVAREQAAVLPAPTTVLQWASSSTTAQAGVLFIFNDDEMRWCC